MDGWSCYMRVGIVHCMAYPQTLRGEGPILETLERIVSDEFFDAVEVTWIKDPGVRKEVASLLRSSGIAVGFAGQPPLLLSKLSLNDFEEEKRREAVRLCKESVDMASELGAIRVSVLSGPDPGEGKRDEAKSILVDSLVELCGYAESKGIEICLESFDRDIAKRSLIGPSEEAAEVAKAVRDRCSNFGLMIDLSHLPLLGESPIKAASSVRGYLTAAHMGNCVLKDPSHPAYGDEHPRFGIEGGEVGARELADYLKALMAIGFLSRDVRPMVSFEVKPLPGESSEAVIANAKRTLAEAWRSV